MKTITYEEFLKLEPCWLDDEEQMEKLERIGKLRKNWSALDILELPDVSAEDALWAVLREELIDASILHEFTCRCVEEALKLVDDTDPSGIAAIMAWSAAETAARGAACVASNLAWDAAMAEPINVARAAANAASDAARDAQKAILIDLLTENK